jgi:hypothetical protein
MLKYIPYEERSNQEVLDNLDSFLITDEKPKAITCELEDSIEQRKLNKAYSRKPRILLLKELLNFRSGTPLVAVNFSTDLLKERTNLDLESDEKIFNFCNNLKQSNRPLKELYLELGLFLNSFKLGRYLF